jgi:hypothetical protein
MIQSLKETAIREYISKINWKKDNWDYKTIEEQMRKFLGERPSLEVKYQKDVMVNEISGESKEFNKLVKVSVVFTDTDEHIKRISIIID